ncbi:c-type cytochrome [Roseovarius sp. Pro17]|uniref:c-type cytochrome n=1 Tax=Roseovarius sp. Pro17 TaxID=3108175 RepID=UPI003A7F39C7
MRKPLILFSLLVFALGTAIWSMVPSPTQTASAEQSLDLVEGKQQYQDYCASCHGANLEGQPDWRSVGPDGILPAPPHDETGHTWHHSDSALFDYTKLGGAEALARQGVDFQSGMPGFGDQLTDSEIRNILAFISSTWPDRQRDVQATRSSTERDQLDN